MDNFTYEYLPLRGVTKETFQLYDAKTKIDTEGKPVSVGFRYPNGAYKVRLLDKKDFYTQGDIAKAGLFGRDKFSAGSHKYVTITEGELDAASLHQVLGTPVVSVQSSVTAHRDCVVDRSWLNSHERIYLAFDNDEPGREAVRAVAKLFDHSKVYVVKFTKYKDANDYLQNDEAYELRQIWWNSKKYLPDNIKSTIDDFKKLLLEPPRWGLPYPFKTLNEMTYGVRRGESVLITAMEGVGKTELMHTFEYQFLKENPNEPLGAIFIEEPQRRHLQALAGLELKSPVHLPDTPHSPDSIVSALARVVPKDDLLYVYSHFGSGDPDDILETVRYLVSARSCWAVLLDHVGMVVSGLQGEDERKALDYLVTQLEMMVKDLNFALIMVSHVNDEGLTRGSRMISKIADIRIDAKRDLLAPTEEERNRLELFVSKNRYSGKTGHAGSLWFDPRTHTYSELPNEKAPSIIPEAEPYSGFPAASSSEEGSEDWRHGVPEPHVLAIQAQAKAAYAG